MVMFCGRCGVTDEAELHSGTSWNASETMPPLTLLSGEHRAFTWDWKNALRFLEQAAGAVPHDFAARYDFAKALMQVNEAGRAVQEARAAIALNPKHAGAHYQLGLAYRQLKQEERGSTRIPQQLGN